jgi:dihydroorotate dehydrogenase
MIDLYRTATRAFHLMDPEDAHLLTLRALRLGLGPVDRTPPDPVLATTLCGLRLPNPIGLAAGFDKNADAPVAMLRAGFGFVECGTVTPYPQAGNPRPRLFRLPQDRAVINRMGFNNAGLEPFEARLRTLRRPGRRSLPGPVGANLGANKEAVDRIADYVTGLNRLWGACDYFTVNISSPNTPGLRALQSRAALEDLTGRLGEARRALVGATGLNPPVFVKVAPDLEDAEIEAMTEVAVAAGINGIIVSNTTLTRPESLASPHRGETGGLSGAPLMAPSTRILDLFRQAATGRLALIGAGGVASGDDAYAKLRAGASAVQLYTAMAYDGPGLVLRIRRELAARLKAEGFASVSEAVGVT